MSEQDDKIKIAVSSCLLGHNVRYDGDNKNDSTVQHLCNVFACVAICPESGIDLGTPRPPLKVVKIDNQLKVTGRTNPRFDVTKSLENYASYVINTHQDICGYIFKSRSPSCGYESTPWFDENNKLGGITSGIFNTQVRNLLPSLPVIEESQLGNLFEKQSFIQQVNEYAEKLKQAR